MSDELERLRADLEVLEKYSGYSIMKNALCDIRDKIAALEAAADPWREAKVMIEWWRTKNEFLSSACRNALELFDHLTAELAAKERRIAELEGVKPVADMQPPFEGPIVGIEPILDPARVLLTAIGILAGERELRASASISDAMFRLGLSATKPYPLKGDENE